MQTIASSITKRFFFILAIAAGLFQTACQKNNSGAPVISHVRTVDPNAKDSFFVQAYPGTLIAIQGNHFDGLQHVYFNDAEAVFNPALNSSTNIIMTIPTNAPTAPPLNSVSNTIKVVTSHGSASFAFTLVLPPPAISAGSNENAAGGTSLVIRGTNFYGISKVLFPGGIAATSFKVDSPTQITVTVPTGITAGDSLHVVGAFGNCSSPFVFDNWMSPTKGFLANFDGTTSQWSPPANNPYFGWSTQGWVGTFLAPDNVFANGTGYCVEINPANNKPKGDNSWWQDNNSIITDAMTWTAASNPSLSNYALKFEANVSNWTAGSIWIATSWAPWAYMAEWAPWKTVAGGKYSSNGWATVTIPLSNFLAATSNTYTSTGTGASSITALQNGGGGMLMVMYSNDGTTTIAGGSFALGLDNFRIVPVK
jgi:hypothetical protein